MIGTTVSHYRILEKLGAGGMGEVYRAADTKLGREVALKVLPPEMARDPERLARFQREARAVAALNHPHIVTIFSVEEADGVHFLTMELVEGKSLDRVIPEGGLPIDQIIEIARALAGALTAAHEKGIIHRDLKPANVMVTGDGRVKVLDFGLAKETRAPAHGDATITSASHTKAGVVMGTPAYMSPEQIAGRAVDQRTDIFSLGIVLYEMATGQRPFEGQASAELISAIMRDTPAPVTDLRSDLPAHLADIIQRCLAKRAEDRYPSAKEVHNELRGWTSDSATIRMPTATASRPPTQSGSGSARADEGFWIAVLPFKCRGASPEVEALAEGLSEEIVTGLSRFSYLRVIARARTLSPASETGEVRTIGEDLGARYVMEGSLRLVGSKLRVAVQLVDATSGAHLWAETYDRAFSPDAVFELQDELVPRIVSTVADAQGILPHSMSEIVRTRDAGQLTPYEAVLRGFAHYQRVNAEEHRAATECLERAVQQAPGNADCWAMLSMLDKEAYAHGFNVRPDSLARAFAGAQRAIEAAPSNHLAYHALAAALFFRREIQAFRSAAERAIALNPMDGFTAAYMGMLMAFAGDWERGCALAERSMQLNPHSPRWYRFASFFDAYRKSDYRRALDIALQINMPGFWRTNLALAVAYSQLGDLEGARKAVGELLRLKPNFAAEAQTELEKWWDPELVSHLKDGLGKAGLKIGREKQPEAHGPEPVDAPSSARELSGELRASEGFWVAVLPFKYSGGDADLEAMADGLTEDITSGLSRFPYLQVIAHNSAMAFKGRSADIRTVGRELGARYVMEGSIRKRGPALRASAQLVDAASGTQLWSDAYDREISDAGAFQVQDDLTDHIVTTVADGYGVLVRSIAAPTRDKNVEDLSASELVLRYYAFMQQVNPQEHALLRDGLERALEREPNHATAWACLCNLYLLEYFDRFNPREKPLERAREAAWRSVKIDPACQMGLAQLAQVQFFSRDFSAFRGTAERAMALNPRDGTTWAFMAIMIAFSGDWERGTALAQRTIELNSHHPGWYHLTAFHNHYRKGEYEAALQVAKKINMPEFHWAQLLTAAACGMLGRPEEARAAIELLRKYNPMFLDLHNVREDLEKWLADKDIVEHHLQGLQKAGLQFGSADSAAPVQASHVLAGSDSGELRAEEGFWVAVLPFKYSGENTGLKSLAEGLSEEIVTGLSRFSYLRVIARSSTSRYVYEAVDVRAAGKELGARYVMEGSLRLVGTKLRIAAQLIDASSGAHLWAETYDRTFNPEAVFELQDDLVPRIVSTVADWYGVLPHSMSETVRTKGSGQLSPYEAVLRSFSYYERVTPEEHAAARAGLEHAVQDSPGYADGWAMLSMMYGEEYRFRFNPQPDSLGRSLQAAQRAADAAPSNHFAYLALAQALFFRKEFDAFRNAAERAIALNPMDGATVEYMGHLIAFAGDWEHGCDVAERARKLNPHHPGWYWAVPFYNAYRKGDYSGARTFALKINMPGFYFTQAMLTALYGQLGEREAAGKALRELLVLEPGFALVARDEFSKWYLPELVEALLDGLRKAGLEIAPEGRTARPALAPTGSSAKRTSGEVYAAEGFWVAVLPLKYSGGDAGLKSLAEGLTEEIVTGLSRFSYLRVIARSSTSRYAHESVDVRAAGKGLGARYVMEGSLRQAGSRLRVTVQLTDATTGAHLWAETYDRPFFADDVFALQDDLVPRIVSTVADQHGVLLHSMSNLIRNKSEDQLTPHEAVLRVFGFHERMSPQEHASLRAILERIVHNAPGEGDCWAMLATIYSDEYMFGFSGQPDPLRRAQAAAQRAIEIAPSNWLASQALAQSLFFRKELQAFRPVAERTIALNRMDGASSAFIGLLLALAGQWERGCEVANAAMQLNPHFPGWYWLPTVFNAYRTRDYRASVDAALRISMPGYFWGPATSAAAFGQLDERERAQKAVKELLAIRPDFAAAAREEFGKWFDQELVEHYVEGLRKAGLEIIPEKGPTYPARATTAVKVGTISGLGDRPAIAVLPFQNLSGDLEQEFFADGITEEIINALAHIPGLRVAGRSSSFSFKGRHEDLRSVGTKLGVANILEGTLRRSGDRLRITAQLIDAGNGYQLWSERYDRVIEDVFAVQDEIATTIAGRLQLSLGADRGGQTTQPPTRNIRAFELYLKGRALLYQRGLSIHKAIDCFTEAVALDPAYAQAWAGMADGYTTSAYSGFKPAAEVMPRALEAARRALQLDPNLAEAHSALACATLLYALNFNLAEKEFGQALELNPNYPQARAWYGLFFLQWISGREKEGREELQRLFQVDPLSSYANIILSFSDSSSGHWAEAVDHGRRGVELDPNSYLAHWSLTVALLCDAQYEEAGAAAERALSMSGRHTWALATLVSIYSAWGKPDQARAAYRELEARSEREYIQPAMFAPAAAAVGEVDRAIAIAQRALKDKDPLFVMLARTWPVYDQLRKDSRFLEIVSKLGLPNWSLAREREAMMKKQVG